MQLVIIGAKVEAENAKGMRSKGYRRLARQVFSNGNSMGLNVLQWPRKSQVKILAFYRLQTISQTSHSLWLVASNYLETACGWERVASGVGGIGCGRRRDSLDRGQEKCVLNLLSQVWRVSQHIHRHWTQEPEIPV